jgi:hypothetical protein
MPKAIEDCCSTRLCKVKEKSIALFLYDIEFMICQMRKRKNRT